MSPIEYVALKIYVPQSVGTKSTQQLIYNKTPLIKVVEYAYPSTTTYEPWEGYKQPNLVLKSVPMTPNFLRELSKGLHAFVVGERLYELQRLKQVDWSYDLYLQDHLEVNLSGFIALVVGGRPIEFGGNLLGAQGPSWPPQEIR